MLQPTFEYKGHMLCAQHPSIEALLIALIDGADSAGLIGNELNALLAPFGSETFVGGGGEILKRASEYGLTVHEVANVPAQLHHVNHAGAPAEFDMDALIQGACYNVWRARRTLGHQVAATLHLVGDDDVQIEHEVRVDLDTGEILGAALSNLQGHEVATAYVAFSKDYASQVGIATGPGWGGQPRYVAKSWNVLLDFKLDQRLQRSNARRYRVHFVSTQGQQTTIVVRREHAEAFETGSLLHRLSDAFMEITELEEDAIVDIEPCEVEEQVAQAQ